MQESSLSPEILAQQVEEQKHQLADISQRLTEIRGLL